MLKHGSRHYSELLNEAFAERKAKNPSYSLRAFARYLAISAAALSQVLSRKRDLSKRNALKVAERLGLSPLQRRKLMSGIRGDLEDALDHDEQLLIQEDVFKLMSDWYYFAILNLAKVPENQADPKWVAKRLGISVPEATAALLRLERLGYLAITKGKLARTTVPLTTTNGVPSAALRSYHQQNLRLAAISLERDPLAVRDISSLTMAIDPSEFEEAKRLIQQFKKKISTLFKSKNPTEVYTLGIQLFPVSKKGETP